MTSAWNKLHLINKTTPDLYIKHELTPTNCTVYLTDLSKIWLESLPRECILQRAAEISTSIDPNEDREQLNVLLQKVQDAFKSKEGTQTKLASGTSRDELRLETSTPLPAPFQPLKWYFQLSRLDQPALTEELLLPLLQDHAGLTADIKALTHSLEEKDHAISKLLDKIESSGIGLTDVFPSLRSHKKITLSVAQKSVPGLAQFEAMKFKWKSETAQLLVENGGQHTGLLEDVFAFDSKSSLRAVESNWWAELDQSERSLNGSSFSSSRLQSENISQNQSQKSESDFQTQTQPPTSKAREEEENAEHRQLSPRRRASIQPSTKRLGKIEASKEAPKLQESKTSLERESPSTVSIEKSPNKTLTFPAPKRAGRLGTIGGKKEKTLTPTPEPEVSPSLIPSAKPRSRLGAIGGKQHLEHKQKEQDVETIPPRQTATPEPTTTEVPALKTKPRSNPKAESVEPTPEATEEEKANRKPNELKRQVNAKAAKVPAMKKRKF